MSDNKQKNILEIRNLKLSFKQRRNPPLKIIRGVDLVVPEGKIIGIVGESGSGKSVATKSLINVNSLNFMTFDSYTFDNKSWKSPKEVAWKSLRGKGIAYIPQNPMTSMNPSRKIGKQILDVVNQFHKGEFKNKKEKIDYIVGILNQFKIASPEVVLKLYPHELSGGMKQRIIIALAIVSNAKVIIADEPTTALDATVQSSVLELLQEVNQKFNISVIFISHNIGVVAKLCDYIYVMYAGKVVEKGSKYEIFTDPKHPYTWALISSIPEGKSKDSRLYTIPGTPPDMANLPPGDPFAPRNKFAVQIDYKQEPPLFEVTPTHFAATWMLHPMYPKFDMPKEVQNRIAEFKKGLKGVKNV